MGRQKMVILDLNLKRKWFDMILDGTKTEEYREIKDYWDKRLKKNYSHIRFRNGYNKEAPEMIVEVKGFRKGVGNPEWGAPEEEVYILSLGEIVGGKYIEPIICEDDSWRNGNYPIAVGVSHYSGKAHIFTSIIIDEGELPDPFFCLQDPEKPAKLYVPKDRPVPPNIPAPTIEWRKVGNNPVLVPMPITTPEADWPTV